MKTWTRYFLYFLIPIMIFWALVGLGFYRDSHLDLAEMQMLKVLAIVCVLLAALLGSLIFGLQARPVTTHFAVSSEKGRDKVLRRLEKLLKDEIPVRQTSGKGEEFFRGEIVFLRGLKEPIVIQSEGKSVRVTAPKKLMDVIGQVLDEMRWEI